MNRNTVLRAARPLVLLAAVLSLSACVVAPPRPYYVSAWHPHLYYHHYYY